eukprot:gb/GECG01001383.1/.p1 GENE.gb/GECG01001383.1/~~gb/GECG01001383.1/.p1  ORF type:complete len:307 (+),score=39.51 gb/GECG01001383.1/:1-921(+)
MMSNNTFYHGYASAPPRCVVDFSQLPMDALVRYATRFGIALPPDSTRKDLVEAVTRHYDVRLDVGDEEEVLARFVDSVRKAGLRDHPNQFDYNHYPGESTHPMVGRDYEMMQQQHQQQQQQQQFQAAHLRPGMQPAAFMDQQQQMYSDPMMMQGYPAFGVPMDQYGGAFFGPPRGDFDDGQDSYNGGRRSNGGGRQRQRRPKQNKTGGVQSPNSRDDDMQPYVVPEDEKFIACDHSHCEKEWYPLSEVGLTSDTIPEGEWYCPQCRAHPDDYSTPAEVPRNRFGRQNRNGGASAAMAAANSRKRRR